jgi:hypothetical protein
MIKDKTKNVVNVIHPYRGKYGIWAFDDAEVELQGEPFVGDINTMIDSFAGGKEKVTVYISSQPIANQTLKLNRIEENEGFYNLDGTDMVGWLCPATLKYFPEYPLNIYAKIEKQ